VTNMANEIVAVRHREFFPQFIISSVVSSVVQIMTRCNG